MLSKNLSKFLFIFLILLLIIFFIYQKSQNKQIADTPNTIEDQNYSSNIMQDVKYISKDSNGNEFIITASEAEIDLSDQNILFLTKINAEIILKNSEKITILSDYGKYNSVNFDTIFSKNVIMNYLDNKITSEYLDFSLDKNQMIISKNVIYTNLENRMIADVIEMNIKTKDTKIFMHEVKKKVNIKNN